MPTIRNHSSAPEVLVIGRSCVDYIVVVERFPQEDRKAPLSTRLVEGGGQGGTAACCITRLGGRSVYVGQLGQDREGRICLRRLEDFGVSTAYVRCLEQQRTPVAYVFVSRSSGKRTIVYERSRLPRFSLREIPFRLLRQAQVILLDPEVTYLAGDLRQAAPLPQIVYDAERWRDGMREMMAVADYFIPSGEFLEAAELELGGLSFQDQILRLARQVKGRLIVTRGPQGAFYLEGQFLCHLNAHPVAVKDTIGAGDNFHAAFALALSRGWALEQAVRLAVAVASLSCRAYGGRNGVPNIDEAQAVASGLRLDRHKLG